MTKAQETSGLGAFAKVPFMNFKLTPTCGQTISIYGLTEKDCCKGVAKLSDVAKLSPTLSLTQTLRSATSTSIE